MKTDIVVVWLYKNTHDSPFSSYIRYETKKDLRLHYVPICSFSFFEISRRENLADTNSENTCLHLLRSLVDSFLAQLWSRHEKSSKSKSKSKSKLHWDWRSVSQYVLVSSPIMGLFTRDFFFFKLRPCLLLGRPLWREVGSVMCEKSCAFTYLYVD
jgi:hypothetical protein